MQDAIGFAVKFIPATDTKGSRYRVTNLQTGKSRKVGFEFSASNPRKAAVAEFAGVVESEVGFIGEIGSRGFFVVADAN